MPKRQLKGIVISDKMSKTVVVSIEKIKEHKKYKRRYKINKKYKAHDEKGEYKFGDRVVIQECRPLSKGKKWKVVSLIERAQTTQGPEPDIETEQIEVDKKQEQQESKEDKE